MAEVEKFLGRDTFIEGLELVDSQWASDENVGKVLERINPKNIRYLNFKSCNKLSDSGIKLIVEKCLNIEAISLINCINVSEKGIQAIAENCNRLRTFALVFDGIKCNTKWHLTNNIFHLLIHKCRGRIENLAIVGFEDLEEGGYLSVIDHFSSTLISFDFGGSQLKKSSIQKITETKFANNIQSLALPRTEISAIEIGSFADKLHTLRCINLANCVNINDDAVIALAKACKLLEIINLNFCVNVRNSSLEALCQNCFRLKKVKLRRTGIERIPFSLVNLTNLTELNLLQCNLQFPPALFVKNGIKGILDFLDECNLSNRQKVMILGPSKSGKSSLLASLKKMKPAKVDTRSHGISIENWRPDMEPVGRPSIADGKFSNFEVWDCSGGQDLLGCHELFMNKENLFLLLFNISKEEDRKEVITLYETIQTKCAGANVIFIATHIDRCEDDNIIGNNCSNIIEQLKQNRDKYLYKLQTEIETLSELRTEAGMVGYRLRELKTLSIQRPEVPSKIFRVSCITGKGFDELTDEIMKKFCNRSFIPYHTNAIPPGLYDVYGIILAIRKASTLFVTESHFIDLLIKKEITDIKTAMQFLEAIGATLKVALPDLLDSKEVKQLCVNPPLFAQMLLSIHCDSLSAQRLLSRELPNALLVEDDNFTNSLKSKVDTEVMTIPRQGLILQSLIPYLISEFTKTNETQILRFIRVLLDQGLLAEGASDGQGFSFSSYSNLSKTKRYYVPLLQLLPQTAQNEIWDRAVLPDIDSKICHIGWVLEFFSQLPAGLAPRAIARCRNCILNVTVQQYWLYGIQMEREGVEIQIVYIPVENVFHICARGDGSEIKYIRRMWSIYSEILSTLEACFTQYDTLYKMYYARCQVCLRDKVEHGCGHLLIPELYEAQSLGNALTCKVTNTEINADLLFPPQGTMKDGMTRMDVWLRSMADAKRRFNRDHKPAFIMDEEEEKEEVPVTVNEIDMKKIKFTAAEAVTRILARATISYLADPEGIGSPNTKVVSAAQNVLDETCMGSTADAIACLSSSNPWSARWAMEDASKNLAIVVAPYVDWKSIAKMKSKPNGNKIMTDTNRQVTCSTVCNIQ